MNPSLAFMLGSAVAFVFSAFVYWYVHRGEFAITQSYIADAYQRGYRAGLESPTRGIRPLAKDRTATSNMR